MKSDIGDLIKAIVLPLTDDKEQVSLTTDQQEDYLIYNLHVSGRDAGRIIGKQGRVAQAIRTVVYSQNHDDTKKVKLNIIPELNND
ncbi:KH domain-containing protein [Bombilactobacillus bombi]|uniref:KH domain-containing protein n=1 Tax=Bombilactobacillus bombi TaxID=1303590 RepID=UPI0015E5CFAE|nr:KH domain-containing protein [Bombilactobacillus bombi]MBA1434718.1 KH domain-containing protein [Bombilactobacillus bombi]